MGRHFIRVWNCHDVRHAMRITSDLHESIALYDLTTPWEQYIQLWNLSTTLIYKLLFPAEGKISLSKGNIKFGEPTGDTDLYLM